MAAEGGYAARVAGTIYRHAQRGSASRQRHPSGEACSGPNSVVDQDP